VVDLGLPRGTLVVLVARSNNFVTPGGGTVLRGGDVASVLTTGTNVKAVRSIFEGPTPEAF
jgi:cell volume regulation protein A